MKRKSPSDEVSPYVTRGNVLHDLGFSASEALEIKVKAEIYRDLLRYIRERELSQRQLGSLLGIHQPDVSNLLNGKISRFSVGKLIQFAGGLNLQAQVRLTSPKPAKAARTTAAGKLPRKAATAA